jgi:hypothetical protein
VEQGRGDGGRVQQLAQEDGGDGDRVGDEILPAHALLPPVRRHAEPERPVDQLDVEAIAVLVERRPKFRGNLGQGGGGSHT